MDNKARDHIEGNFSDLGNIFFNVLYFIPTEAAVTYLTKFFDKKPAQQADKPARLVDMDPKLWMKAECSYVEPQVLLGSVRYAEDTGYVMPSINIGMPK